MLEHYARITLQQDLIDALWKAQAVKMGMSPDVPRMLVMAGLGVHHVVDAVRVLVDPENPFRQALDAFVDAVALAFSPAAWSTLPPRHGKRYHTNRTRTRQV